jgi:dienelactone hydrolase
LPSLEPRFQRCTITAARWKKPFRFTYAQLPFVDTQRVALIGFGGGGLFALPVLLRNAHVHAFVSFEAGLFMPQFAPLLEQVPGFDMDRFDAPLLHFLRDELAVEEEPELLEAAPEGRTHFVYLHAPDLHHHDLAQAGVFSTEVLGLRAELREDVRTANRIRALYTLRFLQAYLLESSEAMEQLIQAPVGDALDDEDLSVVHL